MQPYAATQSSEPFRPKPSAALAERGLPAAAGHLKNRNRPECTWAGRPPSPVANTLVELWQYSLSGATCTAYYRQDSSTPVLFAA